MDRIEGLGTIAALWRYPVKSMRGELCRSLKIDARGVEGDRGYALRFTDGKLASGKNTRRYRMLDGLLDCAATYDGDVPVIRFAGQEMRADDAAIHAALSRCLAQPVSLVREDAVSHLDAGPVHLVTTAALDRLREALPAAIIDERRFRPNLLIEVPSPDPVGEGCTGKILAIGPEVRLRITNATERCRMVTMAQEGLPDDVRILRYLAQEADACFGFYAEVTRPGTITQGDAVHPL